MQTSPQHLDSLLVLARFTTPGPFCTSAICQTDSAKTILFVLFFFLICSFGLRIIGRRWSSGTWSWADGWFFLTDWIWLVGCIRGVSLHPPEQWLVDRFATISFSCIWMHENQTDWKQSDLFNGWWCSCSIAALCWFQLMVWSFRLKHMGKSGL